MAEQTVSWDVMVHHDMEAIRRRDEMLEKAPEYIRRNDGSIEAEVYLT